MRCPDIGCHLIARLQALGKAGSRIQLSKVVTCERQNPLGAAETLGSRTRGPHSVEERVSAKSRMHRLQNCCAPSDIRDGHRDHVERWRALSDDLHVRGSDSKTRPIDPDCVPELPRQRSQREKESRARQGSPSIVHPATIGATGGRSAGQPASLRRACGPKFRSSASHGLESDRSGPCGSRTPARTGTAYPTTLGSLTIGDCCTPLQRLVTPATGHPTLRGVTTNDPHRA